MIRQLVNIFVCAGAVGLAAPFAFADQKLPDAALLADVVFIGEQHDNPGHHALQADWTQALQPTALVFEMLTPEQAAMVTPDNRGSKDTLGEALGWAASGWPDFAMYYPIFAAAPTAAIFGASVPRDQVHGMMEQDLAVAFGAQDATRFGLDHPLPAQQQVLREQMQADAHCGALPEDLLPMMVSVQRLRDATLARAALEALDKTGGPVVVITGNGHARADWGAPFYLAAASPDITLFAVAQGEAGQVPDGTFDVSVDGPSVDRGNPCDAFN